MSENYNRLVSTLKKIFEIDKADLDFGIYKILNQKRDEINSFLKNDLLSSVKEEFSDLSESDKATLKEKYNEAIEQAKKFGSPDPENAEPVLEIKNKLDSLKSFDSYESEIFSHLNTFFSRYYEKGDFISQRRYKKDVYSIPYEGEEVKLYWANFDQYYIKTSEYFKDYTFSAKDGDDRNVRIKLIEADSEKDNVKISPSKERRFVVDKENPFNIKDGELSIHFNFVPFSKNIKQTNLNKESVEYIFAQEGLNDWLGILKEIAPTEKNKKRTLLEKHLNDYTARNTFDYFIHKNIDKFLFRELDFYIKNEMFFLDDIEYSTTGLNELHLKKIVCFRNISKKIIAFLSQVENFQKKLWLKKKFVVEAEYCLTLDLIPDELYEDILKNDRQIEEWKKLFSIEEIDEDVSYTENLSKDFLEHNQNLVLNTVFFDEEFKNKILSKIDNLDERCNGLLINSENFQALNFLLEKYKGKFDCIYIDPPYNTASTPILYKNNYKHSSWASLMRDRLFLSKHLLSENGVKAVAIDDAEMVNLSIILDDIFPDHRQTRVTVVHNPKGSITKDFNRVHEYSLFLTNEADKSAIARTLEKNESLRKMRRWGENSLRTERRLSFYPIYVKDNKIVRVGEVPEDSFHPEGRNVECDDGVIEIWPIDQNGVERRWNFGLDSINQNLDRITTKEVDGTIDLFLTHELTVPKTVWSGGDYDAGNYGNTLLINILGEKLFDFPKSINLVEQCVYLATAEKKDAYVLDYFGGSGTTAHAVMNLNRKDDGNRKYFLVEMGAHFDNVLMPRTQKLIYSPEWKDGKPVTREFRESHCFKYIRLESYEDTLNNLSLVKSDMQQMLLEQSSEFKEDYLLSYFLDVETKKSLLDLDKLEKPFGYKLKISTDTVGVTKDKDINIVDTFNYILGVKVISEDLVNGIKIIIGEMEGVGKTLIIWRDIQDVDNSKLDDFMSKMKFHPRDSEFDAIYINGDHTLEDPRSIVKVTEAEFSRLMFENREL